MRRAEANPPKNASSSGRAGSCAGVAEVEAGDFVRPAKDGAYVRLRVSPGAKSTAVRGLYGEGAIKLSVAAPPTGGEANREAERYLAALIGVERSRVADIVKGASSRDKLAFVRGAEAGAIREGLMNLVRF